MSSSQTVPSATQPLHELRLCDLEAIQKFEVNKVSHIKTKHIEITFQTKKENYFRKNTKDDPAAIHEMR